MSGLDDQAVNENITSIIEQIKASQQNVLKAFEDHNIFVNKSLEKLQQIKTETKVEVVKVKDPLEELKKVRDEYKDRELSGYLRTLILVKIEKCLSLYKDAKISTTFKEIFLKLFNEGLQFKGEFDHLFFNRRMFKEAILKVRDIRWLLLEMEKYPQIFEFNEYDLELMKQHNASRDNIYLVKKFLKKDGDYEEYHSEEEGGGIKFQYHMTGGKLDGEYKIWHKNGTLYCQDYYKEGNKEGESKRWNHDGQLVFQGYYKDGKLEGESKGWDKDGHLLEHIIYDNEGKIVKLKRYHNCGVLDLEKTLIENDTYELTRYYEWDGKIQDQVIMVGNKWNGEYNSWWHNGKVCTKTTYKNDKLDGEWEYWKEDGTLKEKCFYKDGEKQV